MAGALVDDAVMETHHPLAPRLAACRILSSKWQAAYDTLIDRLRRAGTAQGAPGVGDVMPDFALPDVSGRLQRLSDLVRQGPAVLSFNRGSWCPFCREEVGAWSESLDALADAGGRLIIVTPEAGGRMAALARIAGDQAVVLCDVDMGLALRTGLAFPVGQPLLESFGIAGFDLAEVYGNSCGFLPVPATFVIDSDLIVRFAYVDLDFRQRAEPQAVLAVLSALARPA